MVLLVAISIAIVGPLLLWWVFGNSPGREYYKTLESIQTAVCRTKSYDKLIGLRGRAVKLLVKHYTLDVRLLLQFIDGRLSATINKGALFRHTRRYKVLPLEFPFDGDPSNWLVCVQGKETIQPIFNRNGWYYDRKLNYAWLEIDGKAWVYGDREAFDFDLAMKGNNFIEQRELDALDLLIKARLASGWQKQLVHEQKCMRQLRETYRDSAKTCMASLKRFKEKLKEPPKGAEVHLITEPAQEWRS